jgi:hypothetical protein
LAGAKTVNQPRQEVELAGPVDVMRIPVEQRLTLAC